MQDPDLRVHLHSGKTPYYDTCTPKKGFVTSSDGVSIYYEVHGWDGEGPIQDAALDHIPKVMMIMGLACGCSGWRWQLQDLMATHQLLPANPTTPSQLQRDQPQPLQQQQYQQQNGTYVPPAAAASYLAPSAPGAAQQQSNSSRCHNDSNGHQQWQQQQQHVTQEQQQKQQRSCPMLVCVVDNRGVGMSSSPARVKDYSTNIMAQDVLRVMDHLGWVSAHIVGFSMGGMVATKVAAASPERISSLTIIGSSEGGWQIIPHSFKGLRTAARLVTAKSPEAAADATLHMHFTGRTLREWVAHHCAHRRELLRREYLATSGPAQPPHGFNGQLHACWTHRVDDQDVKTIRHAQFPLLVIHGRYDHLASPKNAEQLARRLRAPCIILEGAHFIVRECAGQINMLLSGLVFGERHFQAIPKGPYLDPSPVLQQQWLRDGHLLQRSSGLGTATTPAGTLQGGGLGGASGSFSSGVNSTSGLLMCPGSSSPEVKH